MPSLLPCAALALGLGLLPMAPMTGMAQHGRAGGGRTNGRPAATARLRHDTAASLGPGLEALIRQALSAGPPHVTEDATVMAPDSLGRLMELRRGTNGFTCFPDSPDTPGLDPMCVDAQGLRWLESWMRHDMRPGNTAPGIVYMLQGATDISATDPWARPGRETRWIVSPPHYMVLWPFDTLVTGLSARPKRTGSWIMWAGTPYAHLMVNQVP
ncbi:MAG TPA: hypothetical protein VFS40_12900 [Gemmatimonadales bacterium]|nr:hypothetical protein [Gemmatimonadales bacterium]